MAAYAILDVTVHDIAEFLNYQRKLSPLLHAAGARYLARGGEARVYEGDYEPARLIVVEFPSLEEMDAFYGGEAYLSLQRERDACSTCRIVAVQGLREPGTTRQVPR